MDIFTQGLETERMYLVPLHEKYVEDMFYGLDEEITKYMTPSPAKEIQATKDWCLGAIKSMQNKERILLLGITKNTEEFIGSFDINGLGNNALKAGLWIKQSSHGNRYGREGMLALIQRLRENIDFEYILFPVDKDNIPSRKVAEFADGVLDVDKNWDEIVTKKATQDPKKILNVVHYRIYKK